MTIIGLNNQPVTALPKQPRKKRIHERFTRLVTERSPWVAIWKQQADYILPRRFRDTALMRNKPAQNDKLINNTPTQAARTLASGLMSGLTSPARPWFRLAIPGAGRRNGNLSEDVKLWLNIVENVLREVLIRSNVYNALAHVYGDLGTYCTAGMIVEEDTDEVVRAYTLPLGSFVLMTSSRGQVNGVIREVPMTVAQVVEKFGAENCSKKVQEAAKRGSSTRSSRSSIASSRTSITSPTRRSIQHMRWRSCWYEQRRTSQTITSSAKAASTSSPVMARAGP
jgi:hypothetical protein